MTNETNETINPETTYTATFTLTQKGLGPVHSSVQFTPLTGEEDLKAEAPMTFQIMSELITHFLHVTGQIDSEGNLIDPSATFVDNASVTIN